MGRTIPWKINLVPIDTDRGKGVLKAKIRRHSQGLGDVLKLCLLLFILNVLYNIFFYMAQIREFFAEYFFPCRY